MGGPRHAGRSGLEQLEAEMARQRADALASLAANGDIAARIAGSIARTGRLLLIGMGASHHVNRVAEPCYRRLGVEAWATSAAELLLSPLPQATATKILVSQSGESGEILELLAQAAGGDDYFGMTLDPASALGRALPSLIGAGGGEVAFAATRSATVTLSLHAALLWATGNDDDGATRALREPVTPPLETELRDLARKSAIVISGCGVFRGLAELCSLTLMELARMPAFGFETGQFRHGPMELLSPETGVVLLRGVGAEGAAAQGLARAVTTAGLTPIIFDCSGETPLADGLTVAFPRRQGLGAVLAMLPSLQRLIIGIAASKVERVGEPVRSTKITRAAS